MRPIATVLVLMTSALLQCPVATAAVRPSLSPRLAAQIDAAGADQLLPAIVLLRRPAPPPELSRLPVAERVAVLRRAAESQRRPLLHSLAAAGERARVLRSFWIAGAVYLEAEPEILRRIGRRRDVEEVWHNGSVHLVDPLKGSDSESPPRVASVEWGLRKVMADSAWPPSATTSGSLPAPPSSPPRC